jgi:hypothetical protein
MNPRSSPFPLASSTDAVREATDRLANAKAEGNGYGSGDGASAGNISIGHQDGHVLMVFDRPVGYATLTPEATIEACQQLLSAAIAAGYPHMLAIVQLPPGPDGEPEQIEG